MQPSPQVYAAFDAAVLAGRSPDESTLRALFSSAIIPEKKVRHAAVSLLGFSGQSKKSYGLLAFAFLTIGSAVVERNAKAYHEDLEKKKARARHKQQLVEERAVAARRVWSPRLDPVDGKAQRLRLSAALRHTRQALRRGEISAELDTVIEHLCHAFDEGEARTTYGSRFVEEI